MKILLNITFMFLLLLSSIRIEAKETGLFYRVYTLNELSLGDTIIIVSDNDQYPDQPSVFSFANNFKHKLYNGETNYCINPDSTNFWVIGEYYDEDANRIIKLKYPFKKTTNWVGCNNSGTISACSQNSGSTKSDPHPRFIIKENNGRFNINSYDFRTSYLELKYYGSEWYFSGSTHNKDLYIYKQEKNTQLYSENNSLKILGEYNENVIKNIDDQYIGSFDFTDTGNYNPYSPKNPNCILYLPPSCDGNQPNTSINGIVNQLSLVRGYNFSPQTDFFAKECSFQTKIFQDGGFETICIPFTPNKIEDSDGTDITSLLQFYKFEELNDETARFTKVNLQDLEAGVAYIMKWNGTINSEQKEVLMIGQNQQITTKPIEQTFKGTFTSYKVAETPHYTLFTNGLEFHRLIADTVTQFRAYMTMLNPMNIKIQIEQNNLTHINIHNHDDNQELIYFDLSGNVYNRKTQKNGIYIINGRKNFIRKN